MGDRVCGPGLVKEGRVLPKGGEGVFETRGKGVVPIRIRGMSVNGANKRFTAEARTEGTTMSKKSTWGVPIALLSALCLVAMGFISGNAFATDSHMTRLVGHSDLQARPTLQVNVRDYDGASPELEGKVFAFVGHHRGQKPNPMNNNLLEHNGTTILDVTNPKKPVIIIHIPGAANAEGRATQVAFNHLDSGDDYLIRNQEIPDGDPAAYFEILDITQTLIDGSPPGPGIQIAHKYPDLTSPSGALTSAHKGWWHANQISGANAESYYFGSASGPTLSKGNHLIIWDLRTIGDPKFVADALLPGQGILDPPGCGVDGNYDYCGPGDISLHHPVVDWTNKRVHGAFLGGGDVVVWDISDIAPAPGGFIIPPPIVHLDYDPPFHYPGPHSSMPFYGVVTPNFTCGIDAGDCPEFSRVVDGFTYISNPRDYIIVSDEGFGGDIGGKACQEVRNHLYTIDITHIDYPVTVKAFKVPDGDFCERGISVDPHQFAETQNGKLYDMGKNNNLLYVAYFAKGLRIFDMSDPYNPKEVGHFIPQATANTTINTNAGIPVIRSNDVDLDSRGLAYVSDRSETGLHIIKYLGP